MKSQRWLVLLGVLLVTGVVLPACGGGDEPEPPTTGSVSGLLISPGAIGNAESGLKIDTSLRNDLHVGEPLEVVPGEVIVKFSPAARSQGLQTLAVAGLELRRLRTLALPNAALELYRADGLSQAETLRLVADLRARPEVASAFPNWILHAFKAPTDEYYSLQWHYPAMNLPAAWDVQDGTSNPVTVAVVDSGITQHPDLLPSLVGGYDFVSDTTRTGDGDARDADPSDEGGDSGYHGSHVAGTVAAATNNGGGVAGVSWGAQLLAVRALGVDGSGSFDDIISAIHWAAGGEEEGVPANPNPARVVNLSLGVDIDEPCPAELNTYFRGLADAGVVVVAAAGNDGVDMATSFPANCDGVIAVGATGPQGARAPYSNYGPGIDVMAPGGDVNQTFSVGGDSYPAGVLSTLADPLTGEYVYGFYNGTSMASPHVAGLAALLLAQNPELTFDQLLTRLKAASSPLSPADCGRPSGADCGAGSVDAAKALGDSGESAQPPPPPTGDLKTYVFAFYCATFTCTLFDIDRSQVLEITQTSGETSFTLTGLEEGSYRIGAFQDLNDNFDIDDGEPAGVYKPLVPITAGRNIAGVTVYLQPFTPSAQGSFGKTFEKTLRDVLEPADQRGR